MFDYIREWWGWMFPPNQPVVQMHVFLDEKKPLRKKIIRRPRLTPQKRKQVYFCENYSPLQAPKRPKHDWDIDNIILGC